MTYAVIKIQGKQFKVKEGDEIELEKLAIKEGEKLQIKEVLLLVDNQEVKIGCPYLENVTIQAEVIKQHKGKKIRVATFKAKSRYRRVKGFRPQLTRVKIKKITVAKEKRVKKASV